MCANPADHIKEISDLLEALNLEPERREGLTKILLEMSEITDYSPEDTKQLVEAAVGGKKKGIPIEIPLEIPRIRHLLGEETDRGSALVAAAYLENQLELLLKANLVPNEAVIRSDLAP